MDIFFCIVLECPLGRYGRNCWRRCSKNCNRSCDRKTGVCYGGCRDGWQPPMCNRGICCTILFLTNICSCLKWNRVLTFNQSISLGVIMWSEIFNTLFYMCMYKYSTAYLICNFIYETFTVAWSLYYNFLGIDSYGPD